MNPRVLVFGVPPDGPPAEVELRLQAGVWCPLHPVVVGGAGPVEFMLLHGEDRLDEPVHVVVEL